MAKQARCKKCKIRIEWEKSISLTKVTCPQCAGSLSQTTYLCQDPVLYSEPLDEFGGKVIVWDFESTPFPMKGRRLVDGCGIHWRVVKTEKVKTAIGNGGLKVHLKLIGKGEAVKSKINA